MQMFDAGPGGGSEQKPAFSPDGRWLGVAGGSSRLTFLDTLTGGRREVALPDGWRAFHGAAFTAAGLAVRTLTGEVLVYDPEGDHPRYRVDRAVTLATPLDGTILFAVRIPTPGRAEIARWKADGFAELPPFGGYTGRAEHLAVSADGTRVAAGGGGHIRVWTLTTTAVPKRATYHIRTRRDGWVKCLALSRDGRVLATAARNQVIAWNVAAGAEKFQHTRHSRAVGAVAISPAGPRLVSGGNDGLVFEYDSETGKELRRYDWGIGIIVGLAFAPDGMRCAAVGDSGKVVIWDTDD